MAWRYRKRVKLAPGVYMNISKNGISTSIGVRGASVTFGKNGSYLNTGIPGTGFYNRQKIGMPAAPAKESSVNNYHSKGVYIFAAIMCGLAGLACIAIAPAGLIGTVFFGLGVWANISKLNQYYGKKTENSTPPSFIIDAKTALSETSDQRQRLILSNFIEMAETADAIEDEEMILESLNKKPTKNAYLIASHTSELEALRNKLATIGYDADENVASDVMEIYDRVCQSFEKLLASQKIWVQLSKAQNTELKSSASSIVSLRETFFRVGVFNYIKSKYDIPILPVGNQFLYLYPSFAILSTSPSKFKVIDYDKISVAYMPIRFNEPGAYPSDAEKIGTTWEYVNKNGAPDKRYSNNRQINVVMYGGIILSVKGVITTTFQISNAQSAKDFCSNLRELINAYISDTEVINPEEDSNPDEKTSLSEVINATDKLYHCLVDMSANRQVIECLDRQQQLECVNNVTIGGEEIDNRLAFVAVNDLIKCFEGLGHKADMTTDEGLAIGIMTARIILPGHNVWRDETLMRNPAGQKILEDSYNVFKKNLHVEFDPDKFLLIEMLRHEGVDEVVVNRWAVLLYRYAMLIAKTDGQLSDVEQKWLINILSFTNSNSATPAAINNIYNRKKLSSNLDPLFADVARAIVSSKTVSTSAIQRHFSIGYSRAGLIMDQLEAEGIVGPCIGGKPRAVLMDLDDLNLILTSGTSPIMPERNNQDPIAKPESGPAHEKRKNSEDIPDPLMELENLIGLSSVKTEIRNIHNLVKVQKLRASKGLNAPDISYHCIFTGNPGTGKTTVARLVAQIYKQLGILSKGHLVETDRSGLVAEYVGQTAVKTNKIIDSALDGVLFIDEAYSLVQNVGGNDFGQEAIATLLKRMEDNRDRLVVILAGYSDEMKKFIDSNPGLQSRFNRYINFEDYSADELTAIFEYNLSTYDYRMNDEAAAAIKDIMSGAVAHKDKNFGNARFVRNMFEKTLERQAKRLASSSLCDLTEDALAEIKAEDIR